MVDQDHSRLAPLPRRGEEVEPVARREGQLGDHPSLEAEHRPRRHGVVGVDAHGRLPGPSEAAGVERQPDRAARTGRQRAGVGDDDDSARRLQPLEEELGAAAVLDREGVFDASALNDPADVVDRLREVNGRARRGRRLAGTGNSE